MKTQLATVHSNNLNKKIIVKVHTHVFNKKYKTTINIYKKYTVIDYRNEAQKGDEVIITSTATSKYKKLIKILKKFKY